jgi:hypothetical protein
MRLISIPFLILFGHLFLVFGCKEEPVDVPTITSFKPVAGKVDAVITIYGRNFSTRATENVVKINGIECTLLNSAVDSLVVQAAPGVTTGKISVTIGNLAAISFDEFVIKPHTITSISPMEGTVGDEVTITGSNYTNLSQDVRLLFYDSIPAEIYDYHTIDATDTITTFKTKVPENAATGKITIWIDSTATESATDFTVTP